MKNLYFLLWILWYVAVGITAGYSQLASTAKGLTEKFSSDGLEKYEQLLQQKIREGQIPGAVSMVYAKGTEPHLLALGYSNTALKTSMEVDAIFQLMSMTKPVISVAFMMLFEEGHFLLTDPVSKYLPQFNGLKVAKNPDDGIDGATVAVNSEITIHQILTHTAGFTHGLGATRLERETAKAMYFSPQESIESRVNTLISLPMMSQPGEQWHYSASPDVLALLIEHFSGQSVEDFLQQRLFEPLGMVDTGYNVPEGKRNRVVAVHHKRDSGNLLPSEEQFPVQGNTVFGGTHGLFSTAADYLKFCRMLLNKGSLDGQHYLSPKTVALMTMDHVDDLYNAPGQGFGLGFGVTTDVSESKAPGSVGQFYWSGAWCTYFFVDPKMELISILLTQLQPYSDVYGNLMRQMTYQALIEE